jgi:excisionase family DNA binding protein
MENIIRLSVSEAAKLFGVSTKTIRQALKNQELKYIVVKGRYKINFNSLVEWSQQSTRRFNLLKNQGLGQYVDQWKIRNRKYSPSPELINKKEE